MRVDHVLFVRVLFSVRVFVNFVIVRAVTFTVCGLVLCFVWFACFVFCCVFVWSFF